MRKTLSKFNYPFSEYLPKIITCLKEGYSFKTFTSDLFAGFTVGLIALPLAMAFAIGSGVLPEKGLFTAIVAGFLISLLGGSRVQISGPTGAFVIIIYGIVQRHGYDGLAIATVMGGILMILMGLVRSGVLLKFIPYPVTTGFTTGIAVSIFSAQIKDFFGLNIDKVPPEFFQKWSLYCHHAYTCNFWALTVALSTLILIFVLRHYFPKLPGVVLSIIIATLFVYFFEIPLETIETKFGAIPRTLPTPSFPNFTFEKIQEMFPDAITIALLGAIESLLSAIVADGMIGHRHRSNCELVAQGLGNIGSIIFGGIPATGAIARTTANIKLGAKTPFSGIIHSITLFLCIFLIAPLAAKVPLSTLSAVLIFVAWNMSELPHFFAILRSEYSDALVLVITFLLTVLIDLSVAVQVGVILSAILFLKKMTDSTTVKACNIVIQEDAKHHSEKHDSDILLRENVPEDVTIYEIKGPFFFGVADSLEETLRQLIVKPRCFILRMKDVPIVDTTGLLALEKFAQKCHKQGIQFIISGAKPEIRSLFYRTGIEQLVGPENFFPHIDAALNNVAK